MFAVKTVEALMQVEALWKSDAVLMMMVMIMMIE